MAGGGDSQVDPGPFARVMSPIMKVIGLGIASQGGALGPMLAASGDYIDRQYQDRRDRMRDANLLQLLLPVERQATVREGLPGTLSSLPAPLSTEQDPEAFLRIGTPEVQAVPGREPTPPVIRTWQDEPTRAEVMGRFAQAAPSLPSSVQSSTLRDILRMNLQGQPTRPQDVTEEMRRSQALDDESRQRGYVVTDEERRRGYALTDEERHRRQTEADRERSVQALVANGMPEPMARSAVLAGQPVPQQTKTVFTPDGREQVIDSRTGQVLSDKPIHAPDQAAVIQSVPQFQQEFESAVKSGAYTPAEAQIGRQLLATAKATGDLKPFITFASAVAQLRSKEKAAALRRAQVGVPGAPTVTTSEVATDVPAKRIENKDHIKRLEAAVPAVVAELERQYGPLAPGKTVTVQTKSGPKTMLAEDLIAHAMLAKHGVIVRLQGTPLAKGFFRDTPASWTLIEASTPGETQTRRTKTTKSRRGGSAADEEED